jgi:hypothetical protein
MITLDYAAAHTLACQVVAETGPAHVDTPLPAGHPYVPAGAPRCLVARVLARAGIGLGSLAEHEDLHIEVVLNHHARDPHAHLTRQARGFLAGLQDRNDAGLPWGQALTEATTEAKNLAADEAAERSHP